MHLSLFTLLIIIVTKFCLPIIIYSFTTVPFISTTAAPPKASTDDADLIPEQTANFLNILTFGWLTPLLSLGYARPLEASDLFKLQDERRAAYIGDLIVASFERRQRLAAEYNAKLASGDISPGWKGLWWSLSGNRVERERRWREKDGVKAASLVWSINDSIKW